MCRKILGEVINFITLLKSVERLLTKVYKGGVGVGLGVGTESTLPVGLITHNI